MKLEWKYKIFIRENAFENVICEMAAIFSEGDESIILAITVIYAVLYKTVL